MSRDTLTFQVPAAHRAALRRAMRTAAAQTLPLRTLHADTASGHLAAAGLSLQLRQEGRCWTQALSVAAVFAPGAEHAVQVPALAKGLPTIDMRRHADSAVAALLPPSVALGSELVVVQSDVRVERTRRVLRQGATRVLATLDEGDVLAGDSGLPILELTFECVAGPQAGLVALATRWIGRYGLWLGSSSRLGLAGHCAPGSTQTALRPGSPLTLKLHPDEAVHALVRSCLAHLLPNAACVASGTGCPVHLHQTRVALRRLRTVLRVFGPWCADVDAGWGARLKDVFGHLGAARDKDVMAAALVPELQAAGAPYVLLPPGAGGDSPTQILRGKAFNHLLLELLAFACPTPLAPQGGSAVGGLPAAHPGLADLVPPLINRMHRQIAKDTKHFLSADDAARHQTRKRLKRLRYCVEFVAPMFRAKAVERYLEPLRVAQEALGAFNDLTVADVAFRTQVHADARAWFAVGWLAARRATCLQDCAHALGRLTQADRFWKP
jgi:CHAD domain-containing protein